MSRYRYALTKSLSFQPLEERIAMAASVSFQNGKLEITGTDNDDVVKVWLGSSNHVPQGAPVISNGALWVDPNARLVVSVTEIVRWESNGQTMSYQKPTVSQEFNLPFPLYPLPPGVDAVKPIQEIRFTGGDGNDAFYNYLPFDADSVLKGGRGNDTLYGGYGEDTILGESGNDLIQGGADDDDLQGGSGFDVVYGSYGDDLIDGGTENDFLFGDSGRDTVLGGSGNDMLLGGEHDDELYGDNKATTGSGGMDFLYGNGGNDILDGGLDGFADYLNGGSGADYYVQHVTYRANLGVLAFESNWIISDPTDTVINQWHWVV